MYFWVILSFMIMEYFCYSYTCTGAFSSTILVGGMIEWNKKETTHIRTCKINYSIYHILYYLLLTCVCEDIILFFFNYLLYSTHFLLLNSLHNYHLINCIILHWYDLLSLFSIKISLIHNGTVKLFIHIHSFFWNLFLGENIHDRIGSSCMHITVINPRLINKNQLF